MQFPAALLNVLEFVCPSIFADVFGAQATLGMEHGSNLLVILNSCTKFYIFLLFGIRFRQMVMRFLFHFCKIRRRDNRRDNLANYSRITEFSNSRITETSVSPSFSNGGRCFVAAKNWNLHKFFIRNRPKKFRNVAETHSHSANVIFDPAKRPKMQKTITTTSI